DSRFGPFLDRPAATMYPDDWPGGAEAAMNETITTTREPRRPGPEPISAERLAGHQQLLEERLFQIARKWPQYRRLLADVRARADETPADATVVCLERTLLYGGCSLFAPFFHRQSFVSVDCSPGSAEA